MRQVNKMSETKLKSCPFCGGEAELIKGMCELDNYVTCLGCRCKTKLYNTKASAIKAWNTRKPTQNIVEQLTVELELSDRDKRRCIADKNFLQFDEIKGYANGIYNAIEIVKEEGVIT